MIKTIIFGAGGGGRKLTKEIEEMDEPFEIIAYSDNDPKLQNTLLYGKPIIHPNKIKLLAFDQIIIAAIDTYNITKQLTEECNIAMERINVSRFSKSNENMARISALENAAKLIYEENVQGAVAELGVFQGDFSKHINRVFPDRKLYLFDTFEGFSAADVMKDEEFGNKRVLERSYSYTGTSIELVLGKMEHPENCIIKKGYFPQTAIGLEKKFAFVSLDPDLYNPVLFGLRYFYPRLSTGGIIFIHDYFSENFTGVKKAVKDFFQNEDVKMVPIGDGCTIAV